MIDYHTSHEAALGSLKTEQSAKTYADVQDGNIPQLHLSGNEEICFLGKKYEPKQTIYHGEFDPGSGRTLAACLTHASRTGRKRSLLFLILVANG